MSKRATKKRPAARAHPRTVGAARKAELPPDLSVFLTPKQVAKVLNVNTRTLRQMVATGRFPEGIRFTQRTIRWPKAVIDEYEARLAVPA